MSPLFSSRPKAITFNIRQRRERLLTPLNVHYGAIGLLGLICLYLLIQMAVYYQQAKSQNADALAQQHVVYETAILTGKPLQGIDAKLKTAEGQASAFYADRLPTHYSEIITKLGTLATADHVRLAHNQYNQKAVTEISLGQLTEVQMDASLSGDYRGLVEFMNGLERSKIFFVINNVTLTGQQSGVVNLRMRFTTYLRGLSSDEEAAEASNAVTPTDDAAAQSDALSAKQPKTAPPDEGRCTMKLGTEDKKKLIAAIVLGCLAIVAAVYLYSTFFGGPDAPPPPAPVVITRPTPGGASGSPSATRSAGGPSAVKLATVNGQLDPTLHMGPMLATEALVYSGNGRNIFGTGPGSMPPPRSVAAAFPARPGAATAKASAMPVASGPPPPPPILLKFFGVATRMGVVRALLLSGDDVLLASPGDIVERRYKIVSIAASSILVEDMPNNNKQSLPLVAN